MLRTKCRIASILLLNFFIAKSLLSLPAAEELERQAGLLGFSGVCSLGTVCMPASAFAGVTVYLAARAYAQAKILRSASMLTTGGEAKPLAHAEKVINRFYKNLHKKYPNMQLLKSEVIEFLHLFNLSGTDHPDFKKISWGKSDLKKYAFPKNMLKPNLNQVGDFNENDDEAMVEDDALYQSLEASEYQLLPIYTRLEVRTE